MKNIDMEVDPKRVLVTEDIQRNQQRLKTVIRSTLEVVFSSVASFSDEVKGLFLALKGVVANKFPDMQDAVISNFFFLRFVCPALVSPDVVGLCDEVPGLHARRTLTLISKTLTNLSNNVEFGPKEQFMTFMNEIIEKNTEAMKLFLQQLTTVPRRESFVLLNRSHDNNKEKLKQAVKVICSKISERSDKIYPIVLQLKKDKNTQNSADNNNNNSSSEYVNEEEYINELKMLVETYLKNTGFYMNENKEELHKELKSMFDKKVNLLKPVQYQTMEPSKHIYRLLLDIEQDKNKILEQELKMTRKKLKMETQVKRDLQLQLLRKNPKEADKEKKSKSS